MSRVPRKTRSYSADGDLDKLAIGNEETALTYGLEILERNIETNQQNYTRFLILTKCGGLPTETNKASLSFRIENQPNALVEILQIFSDNQLNCTKIQSVPVANTQLEYSFHLDIEYQDYNIYKTACEEMHRICSSSKILGEYKKSAISFN